MGRFYGFNVVFENSSIIDLDIIPAGIKPTRQLCEDNFLLQKHFILKACCVVCALMDDPLFKCVLDIGLLIKCLKECLYLFSLSECVEFLLFYFLLMLLC